MKKILLFIFVLSCSIAQAQVLTCGELVKLMKAKEMTEVDDFMTEKQFIYEKGEKADKKSALKTNNYTSQEGDIKIQRTMGKEAAQNELIVTTKSKEYYESVKKGAKQSAFAAKKDATGPVTIMDNKTFLVEFDPTAGDAGGLYKIRFSPSPKK